jgi:hypothetical protein
MFKTEQCQEFLTDGHAGKPVFGASPVAAINLAAILNKLLELGTSLPAIFAKAMAIYAIVTGPGTWTEKATAIFALFALPPQPSITLAD